MYKTLLQNIAYKMFKDKIYGYVQDSYIYTIILEYKEKHSGMRIAISKLIERMVDYRFLENKGDTYRFKYSYMYFYFAGSYIAKKMNPEKRAEVIKEVFDNIDNDLNYNIALFLAYNLSIEYDILPIVSKMSDSLLTEFKDFKYENVRALIAEWGGNIEKKIERIYTVPENDQIPLLRSRKLQEQEEAEGKREESTDLNEEFEENNSSGVHEEMKQTNQEVLKVGRLVDYVGKNEGLDISLKGQWKESERYGKQYHVASFEIQMPTTGEGVKAYLSSGLIKGVGPIIAERIVDRFGKNTFYVFEQCPERLLEIPGITQRKLDSILEGYHKSENIRQLSLFLSSAGVTPKKIEKIQEHFGHKAVSIIKKDPFRLCEMEGFGFKTVDPIARKVKHFQADNPLRIKAAILYVLKEAEGEGHLYLEVPEILTRTKSLLFRGDKRGHVTERKIRDAGNSLIKDDKELVCSYTKIYSKKNYESEQKAVIQLAALSRYPIKRYDVEKWISGLESKENIQLAEKQRKGIEMVFQNPVSIITGGPGSGKTTLLRFIVMIQEKLNIDSMILLAAPTGRARQRMYEATGYPALTIHKSIGLTGADGEEAWNAGEMLCDDLIIIDECSMVDMHLFTSLMMKIKTGSRIVFVGDKDQLESVGPGNVFKELIDSRVIPVTVLDQCFRQENPTILENAIKINCGKQNLVYDNSFSFVAAHDDEEAAKKIMKLFDMEWKLQRKNVNAVQVLTPLREDTKVSANALNLKIKDRINPYQIGQQEIKNGNKIFRIQDKVMQTKNEDEISNGDIGIVRKIGKVSGKKYMEVDFGEERVMRYQEGESWNLVHAYAITAHKGQGSEYPVVIIPILSCFRRHTLKRNLYYTAITRAKRKVILVGSKQAFSQAIRAGRSKKRNTLLSYRLKKAFTEVLDKNEAA